LWGCATARQATAASDESGRNTRHSSAAAACGLGALTCPLKRASATNLLFIIIISVRPLLPLWCAISRGSISNPVRPSWRGRCCTHPMRINIMSVARRLKPPSQLSNNKRQPFTGGPIFAHEHKIMQTRANGSWRPDAASHAEWPGAGVHYLTLAPRALRLHLVAAQVA
jgi:hypothetical protein